MSIVLETVTPTARIHHQCSDCGRTIQPGETYQRQRGIHEGDPYTWKACRQCAYIASQLWATRHFDDDGLYLPDVDWLDVITWSIGWALLARGFQRRWRNDDGSLMRAWEVKP